MRGTNISRYVRGLPRMCWGSSASTPPELAAARGIFPAALAYAGYAVASYAGTRTTRYTPSLLYTSLPNASRSAVVKRPADPFVSGRAVPCRLTKPGMSRNASIARATTARFDDCSLCGDPSPLVGDPPALACGNPSPLMGVHASYPRVPPRSSHDTLAPLLTRFVSLYRRLPSETARSPPSTATAPTPCGKEGRGPPEVPARLVSRGRGADEAAWTERTHASIAKSLPPTCPPLPRQACRETRECPAACW